jgi:hypothetical protein
MKVKGLKILVEDTFGYADGGGQAAPASVIDARGQKARSVRAGQDERAKSLLGGVGDAATEIFTNPVQAAKYGLAGLATPRQQLMAAASGRSSGLGWSKEAAQQRFTHFRKELPNLVKSYVGMAGSAVGGLLGQNTGSGGGLPPTGSNYLGRIVSNPTVNKVGSVVGKLLKPLAPYASSAGDEMAKIAAAATGDFRDASALANVETPLPKAKR